MNPTPNAGRLAITLRPRNERKASVDDIVARLKQAVAPIPGMTVFFQPVQDIQISTRLSRAQYQYTLVAARSEDVIEWADKLVAQMRKDPMLREVASEAQEGGLRMLVQIDREKAGRLGVSMQAVNDTLNNAFGQRQISTIYGQANQYRVILEAEPRYQRDPNALSKLYVTGARTSTGTAATVATNTVRRHQHEHDVDPQHRHRQQPDSAQRVRPLRACLGAACDRAPGPVSRQSPSASTSPPTLR